METGNTHCPSLAYMSVEHVSPNVNATVYCQWLSQYNDESALVLTSGVGNTWCLYTALLNYNVNHYAPLPFSKTELGTFRITQQPAPNDEAHTFIATFTCTGEAEYKFTRIHDDVIVPQLRRMVDEFDYDPDLIWDAFLHLYELVPQMRKIQFTDERFAAARQIAAPFDKCPHESRFLFEYLVGGMLCDVNTESTYESPGKKLKARLVNQTLYKRNMSDGEIAKYYKNHPKLADLDSYCRNIGLNTPNLPEIGSWPKWRAALVGDNPKSY